MEQESLIKLLTEALKFYAEPANYSNNQINLDKGHQARFIIEMAENNRKTIATYEKEFDELQEKQEDETTPEELLEKIIEIGKLGENHGR